MASGQQAYTLTLQSGWTDDVVFAFVPGLPPPKCLRLSPAGAITGYPMTVGIFPIAVRITSRFGATLTTTCTLRVAS